MSMGAIGAAVVGGGLSYMAANSSNEASAEAAEASRDLPEWLKPYYIGGPGAAPEPTPLNYNWLDSMNTMATTGMPGAVPPMSMNNPMMTLENVYTPTAGGPWGQGLGPGQLTTQAGIPGAPGAQFVQPGEGFQPGLTGAPAPQEQAGGGGMDPSMLDLARQYMQGSRNIWGSPAWEQGKSEVGLLDALQWAQANPGASGESVYMAGLLAPYGYGG